MARKVKMGLMEAQKAADEYARGYLRSNAIPGLMKLDDDEAKALMGFVMQAIVNGWGTGFYAGQ